MDHWWFRKPGITLSGLILLSLALFVACGGAAATPIVVERDIITEVTKVVVDEQKTTEAPVDKPEEKEEVKEVVVIATPTTSTKGPAVTVVDDKPFGVLRIGIKDLGPPQFHPKNVAVPQSNYVDATIFEAMWKRTPGWVLENHMLEDWSVSEDFTTWTLTFKDDIPFHKGWGNFTTEDFVWIAQQTAEEGSRSNKRQYMARWFLGEGRTTEIIDAQTVVVKTGDIPAYDFSWRWQQAGSATYPAMSSKKYADSVGEEKATLEGIGTGAWQFVEWRTNERFISEAVEDHWDKTPYFKELQIIEIPEESTRIANFLSGEIDTMQMSLSSIPALLDSPDAKFMRYENALELHMTLHGQLYIDREGAPARDTSLPWISESADLDSPEWEQARKVREALRISIDREAIVDTILEGEGHANNPYWRWTGYEQFFDDEMRNTKVEFDVERAKQLLKDAGWEDGFEIDVALTGRSYPGTPLIGEAVCQNWVEINVRCKQQRMPMTAFRPHFLNRTWKGLNTHDNSPVDEPINALRVPVPYIKQLGLTCLEPLSAICPHCEWAPQFYKGLTLLLARVQVHTLEPLV